VTSDESGQFRTRHSSLVTRHLHATIARMNNNFFTYQQRRLRILFGWGVGSTVAGLPLMLSERPFWRNVGMQASSWGLIDALLAVGGLAGARRKEVQLEMGTLPDEAARSEARSFQRILLLNAGLDLLYIAGGLGLARRSANKPGRQGMGIGIALQGLFLLAYDALLAREVGERWLLESSE
jgi:hypothetical protein